MNDDQLTRLGHVPRQQTARQVWAAWWRSRPASGTTPTPGPSDRLDWVDPASNRIAAA